MIREILDAVLGRTTLQAVVALTLTAVFTVLALNDKIPVEALLIQFGFITAFLFKPASE